MKNIKLGHQAPKGLTNNKMFNFIEVKGDLAYCKSHNFLYDSSIEQQNLYNAIACYYTDSRFIDGKSNNYKESIIHGGVRGVKRSKRQHREESVFNKGNQPKNRWRFISLKSAIRRIKKCSNIPVGTVVHICTNWNYVGKRVKTSYLFKVRKEKVLNIQYEISNGSFSNNFTTCLFSKALTDRLRDEGFIVKVWNLNPNFIDGDEGGGEIAVAYGHNKKIGFSSGDETYMGYGNGCDNILYDFFGEFDKWSRCNEIPKSMDIDSIVEQLKSTANQHNLETV